MKIHKILVPVDGSAASFAAFQWACELAQTFGAQLHMVYMVHVRWENSGIGRMPISRSTEESDARKEGLRVIKEFSGHAPSDIQPIQLIAVGPPAEGIVHLAHSIGVDLIIMGNRGLGMVKGLAFGSVFSYVLKHANCPVLVTKEKIQKENPVC